MSSRDEALDSAAACLAQARADQAARTPREAAEAAWRPGGPSVDDLEAEIRHDRGLPAARSTEQGAA